MFHVRYLCSCGFGVLITVKNASDAPKFRQCQVCHSQMKAESLGQAHEGRTGSIMDNVRRIIKEESQRMMKELIEKKPVSTGKKLTPLSNEEFGDLIFALMNKADPLDVGKMLNLDQMEGIQKNPLTEKVPYLGTEHNE